MEVKLINMNTNDPLGTIYFIDQVSKEKDESKIKEHWKYFRDFKPSAEEKENYFREILKNPEDRSALLHVFFTFLVLKGNRQYRSGCYTLSLGYVRWLLESNDWDEYAVAIYNLLKSYFPILVEGVFDRKAEGSLC